MKILLAGALLLLAVPASAGTLTWVVTTGSNTPPTVTAPGGGTPAHRNDRRQPFISRRMSLSQEEKLICPTTNKFR